MSEVHPEFGPRLIQAALKRWAQDSGVTQAELAARTGITQSTLSRLLSSTSPRIHEATRAALLEALPLRYLHAELRTSPAQSSASGNPERPVVFVSSTYLDNKERREWVREAIERADMVPLCMERWTADPLTPQELCIERVREADVYLCILAWRYGWIPPGEEKSITELEYEEALRLDKPRLVFLLDQPLEQVNIKTQFDADEPSPWRKQLLLEAFKGRLRKEQTALPFVDAKLQTLVLQALFLWKEERWKKKGGGQQPAAIPTLPAIDSHRAALAEYLQWLQSQHAYVVLPGFEQRLRIPLLLDELYVPLNVEPGAKTAADWKVSEPPSKLDPQDEAEADQVHTLVAALAEAAKEKHTRGLVLLGHPGAGKTTQLRRLALSVARADLAESQLQGDFVPLFLPLRQLEQEDKSLYDFARRLLETPDLNFGEGFVASLWEHGKLLILIDGLDEVPQARRKEVRDWIERVVGSDKGNVAVVSCRHQGYTSDVALDHHFRCVSLRPLSDESRSQFILRWYEAVETGLLPERASGRELSAAKSEARASANRLIQRLSEPEIHVSRIYELAANPLLLTTICLVHRDRGGLPERIEELYKEAVEILLEHWRKAKGLPQKYKASLARQVLQPVALWLHEKEGRTQASEDELRPVLAPAMREVGWIDHEPLGFLATIRDESGLLTGWSSEHYGFLHLGFQEYLAAQELYRAAIRAAGDNVAFEQAVRSIVKHYGPTWWREVIALIFAIDEQGTLFAQLFREVLKLEDLPKQRLLSLHCVRQARRFTPDPFRELLRAPVEVGRWQNRLEACELLVARGKFEVVDADLAPALALLDRKAKSITAVFNRNAERLAQLHEDQLLAAQIVRRLAPDALRERASRLRNHPHPELAALVRDLTLGLETATGRKLSGSTSWTDPRTGCTFVHIPEGRFLMGSPSTETGRSGAEGPQHEVQIQEFLFAAHPVTNRQYAKYLAANKREKPPKFWADKNFNQPEQPVVGLSWEDADSYCKWAGYRLPTEAEWEYACRAGTTTPYWSGDSVADLLRVGWISNNSEGRVHSVAEKQANPFGLFDMHGNVWEWCEDGWHENYEGAPGDGSAWVDEASGFRVVRGGSSGSTAEYARSAFRNGNHPSLRWNYIGFRPARSSPPDKFTTSPSGK